MARGVGKVTREMPHIGRVWGRKSLGETHGRAVYTGRSRPFSGEEVQCPCWSSRVPLALLGGKSHTETSGQPQGERVWWCSRGIVSWKDLVESWCPWADGGAGRGPAVSECSGLLLHPGGWKPLQGGYRGRLSGYFLGVPERNLSPSSACSFLGGPTLQAIFLHCHP